MRRIKLFTGFLCLWTCGVLGAADPAWWSTGTTAFIDPNVSHAVSGNYVPANQGQLKNIATKAALYLNIALPSPGAGSAVNNMVAGFQHTPGDYAPVNIGQLKAIAKPFYDRLLEPSVGYNTKDNLITRGLTGWLYDYPWKPFTATSENYAPANIGQLKIVFSFELPDVDTDGLPDSWEVK